MPPRVCLTCKESTNMMKLHVDNLNKCPEWKLGFKNIKDYEDGIIGW